MSAELSPADKLVGKVLSDRYQILHRLGEGAMGVVYQARHVKVGRMFAIKVLHARSLRDPKVARRFEREAELAGRLRHPNVVGVVDVGDVEGTRYMVMDFAEGPDLARLLDEAPMPPERIIHLVRQMLEGLYHAHEQGLIHRDFKPENVIVERDHHGREVPRIVDFGIALLRDGGDSADGLGRLTTNGLVLGTPHYMAPEQAVADPIDHRIDLFALGIVIYEMLSGRLPYDGNGAEVARANLLLDPPPIVRRVPHLEVDPLLEAFARRLMAKRRDARPSTAKAARELLDLIERDRTAAAKLLGVPVARSGRTPAVTESVAVDDDPSASAEMLQVTARMKPTPRPSQPVSAGPGPAGSGPAASAMPPPPAMRVPEVLAEPGFAERAAFALEPASPADEPGAGGFVPGAPFPPGVLHPGHLAGAHVIYGAPRMQGRVRDTAIRTPLGWQAASWPSRRRPWLIGGALIGAASIAAAVIITLGGPDPEVPAAGEQVVISGADPARPGSPGSPGSPGPDVRRPAGDTQPDLPGPHAPAEAVTAPPAPPAPVAADPPLPSAIASDAVAPGDPRRPGVPRGGPRRVDGKAGPTSGVPGTAGAVGIDRASSGDRVGGAVRDPSGPGIGDTRRAAEPAPPPRSVPEVAAAGTGEPVPPEATPRRPPVREPRTVPRDPPRAEPPAPAVPMTGVTASGLASLYDSVGVAVRELPDGERGDLMNRLTRLNLMVEMRAPQDQRDRAAAQLVQIRDEARRRKLARQGQ